MYKEVFLTDGTCSQIFIGKRALKADIFNSSGSIPLYSANVFEPFGYVNKGNIDDFEHDYILWGIDGNFKFNLIKKGQKFATTDHCGAIKILDKNIISEYLLQELISKVKILGYDRTLRSSLANMKRISIKIPVNKIGSFDLNKQDELIKKFITVEEVKNQLKNELESVSDVTLDIVVPFDKVIKLTVDEIFDLDQSTNNSNFTKEFVNNHKGNIPVYSASKNTDDVSYGYVAEQLPHVKYFKDILTWNIDGSVGKAFYRSGMFTLSEKVIPLILQEKWEGLIDVNYVKYVLEKKSIERGFMFSNKAGKTRIKDIEIEIPTKEKLGVIIPDIKCQKELAIKYSGLYEIKTQLYNEFFNLYHTQVEII